MVFRKTDIYKNLIFVLISYNFNQTINKKNNHEEINTITNNNCHINFL
ncbi:hypothetical protein CLU81_4727 [Flavobacterium sp. 9]|nr:hypothetical protein CLU81_4727 [Flavobacterium sp. 9]